MTNAQKIEILEKAKAKIQQGWCQRQYARSKNHYRVNTDSPQASQWCVYGAIYSSVRPDLDARDLPQEDQMIKNEIADAIQNTLRKRFPNEYPEDTDVDLVRYNDEVCQTQEEMVDLLTETINRVKEGAIA